MQYEIIIMSVIIKCLVMILADIYASIFITHIIQIKKLSFRDVRWLTSLGSNSK